MHGFEKVPFTNIKCIKFQSSFVKDNSRYTINASINVQILSSFMFQMFQPLQSHYNDLFKLAM